MTTGHDKRRLGMRCPTRPRPRARKPPPPLRTAAKVTLSAVVVQCYHTADEGHRLPDDGARRVAVVLLPHLNG